MKTAQTISLKNEDQKQVTKEASKIQKQIKSGKISIKEGRREQKLVAEKSRGLIYLGHLPHGFYEEALMKYFKQFGKVTNVKVCRSRKSGNSKGYGYVEFLHPEVAKIAAETMNDYIMFKRRVVSSYVPYEKRPKGLFHGKQSMPDKYSRLRQRNRNNKTRNGEVSEVRHLSQSQSRVARLQRRLEFVKKMGVDYDLKPSDVPKGVAM